MPACCKLPTIQDDNSPDDVSTSKPCTSLNDANHCSNLPSRSITRATLRAGCRSRPLLDRQESFHSPSVRSMVRPDLPVRMVLAVGIPFVECGGWQADLT